MNNLHDGNTSSGQLGNEKGYVFRVYERGDE